MHRCENSQVLNDLCQEVLDSSLNQIPVPASQGVEVKTKEAAASWLHDPLGKSRGRRGESVLKSEWMRSTGPCPEQTL